MYADILNKINQGELTVPKTLRLSDKEQDSVRKKCIEINKLLIKEGKEPFKDSELIHEILRISMPYVRVNARGEIQISDI